jgi:hypothetical protein
MGCLPWDKGCKCKNRCEGVFSHPGVVESCKGWCKSSSNFKNGFINGKIGREDFLCSGKYIDLPTHMLATNVDPCPNDDLTLEDLLDPTNQAETRKQKINDFTPVIIGGAVFIGILLLYFIWK